MYQIKKQVLHHNLSPRPCLAFLSLAGLAAAAAAVAVALAAAVERVADVAAGSVSAPFCLFLYHHLFLCLSTSERQLPERISAIFMDCFCKDSSVGHRGMIAISALGISMVEGTRP